MIKFACSEEEEDDTAYEDMLAYIGENYRPLPGAPPFSEELLLQYGLFILDQGLYHTLQDMMHALQFYVTKLSLC